MVTVRRDFPLQDPHCMQCGSAAWVPATEAVGWVSFLAHQRAVSALIVRGDDSHTPRTGAASVSIQEYMVCAACGHIHWAWGDRFHLPAGEREAGGRFPPAARAYRPFWLSGRDRWVLEQRYRGRVRYADLAAQLGVTLERVRSIEHAAISTMLDALESEAPTS